MANIEVPAGNNRLDFVPYPILFIEEDSVTDLAQYPEIPRRYHIALVYGAVADFLGNFHERSKEFARAGMYEARYQALLRQAKAKRRTRPFDQKPVKIYPRFR